MGISPHFFIAELFLTEQLSEKVRDTGPAFIFTGYGIGRASHGVDRIYFRKALFTALPVHFFCKRLACKNSIILLVHKITPIFEIPFYT